MSQTLVKKAFCLAQYSCIGRCLAKDTLRRKVDPNHSVYRNTDPVHMDVFRQLSIHEKSVEKLYEIFCEIDKDGSGEISHYEFFLFLYILFQDRFAYNTVFGLSIRDIFHFLYLKWYLGQGP